MSKIIIDDVDLIALLKVHPFHIECAIAAIKINRNDDDKRCGRWSVATHHTDVTRGKKKWKNNNESVTALNIVHKCRSTFCPFFVHCAFVPLLNIFFTHRSCEMRIIIMRMEIMIVAVVFHKCNSARARAFTHKRKEKERKKKCAMWVVRIVIYMQIMKWVDNVSQFRISQQQCA